MKEKSLVGETALRAAGDLRAQGMQSRIALPGDAAYNEGRQIFNAAVNFQPAMFAICETPQDVQMVVRVARARGLPLSVRGGGHDWAGRALRHEGIVIDLSKMRGVVADAKEKVATVGGGATGGDLMDVLTPIGLTAVTAAVASVGMVGFTIGGGYGPLSPKLGLAIDNVVGAEVVLPDGQLVSTNAIENPELFWALRGGGGNFGVVTALRARLHPIEKISVGAIVFPWTDIKSTLRNYAEFVESSPDELATIPGLSLGPDGELSMMIAAIWCGDAARGERVITWLQHIGKPSLAQIAVMATGEMLAMFESNFVKGRHYAVETRSLSELTPAVIEQLVAAMENRTSPYSSIAWHHCHGAPTRVPNGVTPFGVRDEHFMLDLVATWDSSSEKSSFLHQQWARDVSQSIAPMALPGGYPNMLGPDAKDQIPYAYGNNAARLLKAKKHFDPAEIFTSATPLPPG